MCRSIGGRSQAQAARAMIQEAVSGLILRTHAGYAQDVLLSALCPSGWQRARLRSVVPLKRTI